MQQINQGLPEAVWREYDELISRRQEESLTMDEHARLLVLAEHIESAHIERLELMAKLAQLRQIPLETVMEQLGIKPREISDAPAVHH